MLGTIVMSLISTIIMVPISALLLMAATKILKIGDSSFKTALRIALIIGVANLAIDIVLSFLPVIIMASLGFLKFIGISIVLALYLVKTTYQLEWIDAAKVWGVWFVLGLVAGFIIGAILGAIFFAVGLGLAGAAAI